MKASTIAEAVFVPKVDTAVFEHSAYNHARVFILAGFPDLWSSYP